MHAPRPADCQSHPSWLSEQLRLFAAATHVNVWFARSGEPKSLDVCHIYRSGNGECRAKCERWHECQAQAVEKSDWARKFSCPMKVDYLWAQVACDGSHYGYLYTDPVLPADEPMPWRSLENRVTATVENASKVGLRKQAFQRILRAKPLQRDGLLLLLGLLADQLAARFEEESRLPVSLDPSESLVQRAKAILCNRYHEDISTSDVAGELHVSESHLCHAFKRVTGGTLRLHLNELRFSEACRMLREHPRLTVAEVAYAAGFQSLSRFNEQFRRRKMPSPSKWRLERSAQHAGCSAG